MIIHFLNKISKNTYVLDLYQEQKELMFIAF